MSIHIEPAELSDAHPRMMVIGVGGAGGNAVNNMVEAGVDGVEFIAANTDAQELSMSIAGGRIQMGLDITEGLGAGLKPEIGAAAAEEALDDIRSYLEGVQILFITAGMGGGTGTGAAPVIARAAKDMGILTVAVVTKPFKFEGQRRMKYADKGIAALAAQVDTVLVIPNQNLFRVASKTTTFADAFDRANDVLRSGVSCITELMINEGLSRLDLADIKAVMQNMGTTMIGAGDAADDFGATESAELAVSNWLLEDGSMNVAEGLLTSIIGNQDHLILYQAHEAAEVVQRQLVADDIPSIQADETAHDGSPLRTGLNVSNDMASGGRVDTPYRWRQADDCLASHADVSCNQHDQATERALSGAATRPNTRKAALRAWVERRLAEQRDRIARTMRSVGPVWGELVNAIADFGDACSPRRERTRNAIERILSPLHDFRRMVLRNEFPATKQMSAVCLVATLYYFL
ncbi:cell division protein FtsZ [Dichotomicrobium thermohalophilum]|uniref:Cell division protein FtsZ n=1 Tax=Dichotomicrobium thermohalophilum TaxID=933063 RepID=A0A397Q3U4_9HYPH|nr:cell division protein FtsZ [Dichotomicrobium thermohalophilum]RIA55718.1 cell division protein FtsZ [Dichotomicrobium thermohalophilum]